VADATQLAAVNAELQSELVKHKEEGAAIVDLLRKQADDDRGAVAAAKAGRRGVIRFLEQALHRP
jgi:hypothetical protein